METYFPHLASPAAPSKKAKQTARHLLPVAGLLLSGLCAWFAFAP